MGYRITIDRANCINCGVCMDVCPVEALDMSRPSEPASKQARRSAAPRLDDGIPGQVGSASAARSASTNVRSP